MKRVDVVYVMILNMNSEILIVKNKRSYGSDYTLPGGAVETGETLHEAAIREVKEETGLDIEVGDLLSVNEAFFERKDHHALFFTFGGKQIGGNIDILFPEEIEEVLWMDLHLAEKELKHFGDGLATYFTKQSAPYYWRGRI